MASKNITTVLLPIALIAAPVWAGHVTLVNNTDQYLRMECGEHHDREASSRTVSPGRTGGLSVHGQGKVSCRATNDDGDTVDAREFDFHGGDDSVVWRVDDNDGDQHHHDDGDEEGESPPSLAEQLTDQVDLLKNLFGGGGGDDE